MSNVCKRYDADIAHAPEAPGSQQPGSQLPGLHVPGSQQPVASQAAEQVASQQFASQVAGDEHATMVGGITRGKAHGGRIESCNGALMQSVAYATNFRNQPDAANSKGRRSYGGAANIWHSYRGVDATAAVKGATWADTGSPMLKHQLRTTGSWSRCVASAWSWQRHEKPAR
eukprot:218839-Chlamydomonas_euryale.AAC.8